MRSERAAGEAQYHAAFADVRYVRESIAATVGKSWILAIEAKRQRDLADQIVRASERAAALVRDFERVGIGDQYDVVLADSIGGSFEATAPRADAAEPTAVSTAAVPANAPARRHAALAGPARPTQRVNIPLVLGGVHQRSPA